jgi:hypothetical protein
MSALLLAMLEAWMTVPVEEVEVVAASSRGSTKALREDWSGCLRKYFCACVRICNTVRVGRRDCTSDH